MIKIKIWRRKGPAPAPFVVRGRPWKVAARFIAQAIRLGRVPQVLWVLGWRTARQAAQALKGLGQAITGEVIKGADLPIRERKVHVPGWAFWALDFLGREAREAREKAFREWLLATTQPSREEGWEVERGREREEWPHETGRPAPSFAHALARAWEELEAEGVPLPRWGVRLFVRTLAALLVGEEPPLEAGVAARLEERAVKLLEGGWFPPSSQAALRAASRSWRVGPLAGYILLTREEVEDLLAGRKVRGVKPPKWAQEAAAERVLRLLKERGEIPPTLRCRLWKPAPRRAAAPPRDFTLRELEVAVARALQGEEVPELVGVVRVLEEMGLEWPRNPGTPPRGVSPLWWVIYWAGEEKEWGALAERLGTWNPRALRAARALQRAAQADPQGGLEAWAKAAGVKEEEAQALWALLHQGSVEEWTRGRGDEEEDLWEEEAYLPSYEEILEEEEEKRQREALAQALEALGLTAEEVLANPALFEEVARLARAFYDPGQELVD